MIHHKKNTSGKILKNYTRDTIYGKNEASTLVSASAAEPFCKEGDITSKKCDLNLEWALTS